MLRKIGAWSQLGPPVTIGGPTGSGYVVLEPEVFIRLYVFDKCLCIKKILSKSVNNANLTPPQTGHAVTKPKNWYPHSSKYLR